MIVRSFEGPLWAIYAPTYSEALRTTARSVPGMRWVAGHSSWVGYPDAVEQVVKKLAARGVRVQGELPLKEMPPARISAPTLGGLREYQREGVRFAVERASVGVLIADQMGLGKSVTAIRAAKALRAPCITVCPSFVRMVWRREVERWRPKAHVISLEGTKPKAAQLDALAEAVKAHGSRLVVLVHYDVVHAWVKPIIECVVQESRGDGVSVIFDEAHVLQSDRSRRSAACRELAAHCTYRIGLSGTPMTSRPRDLWNVVETLSPGRFGRPFDFYISHCAAKQETISTRAGARTVWDTTGASRLDELKERLAWFMIRRTVTDVKLELPPRTRQVIEMEVPRANRSVDATKRNEAMMREALAIAADGKLPKILELVSSHIEQGAKVVIFCHRVAVAEALAASFVTDGVHAKAITGAVAQKERERIVDEQPTVLCATMDSTSTGVDLTFANVALFVELDWVPSKLLQCEARLDRFGQKRNVLVQYVIASATVDEIIRDAVITKLGTFEASVGKLDDKLRADLQGAPVTTEVQLSKLAAKLRAMME